jgi:hypothetical protein
VFVVHGWVTLGVTTFDILQYIKRFFFEGSYATIWFLPALITSVTIVFFMNKKFSYFQIFMISIPLYVFGCLGSSYFGLTEYSVILSNIYNAYFSFFDTVKNGFLFGLPFVAIGGLITEVKEDISKPKYLAISVLLYLMLTAESITIGLLGWSTNGVDLKILLIPLSYFIVLLVLNVKLPNSPIYEVLRKLSIMIFLSQRIFLTIFPMVWEGIVNNQLVYFVLILASTVLFSYSFIRLSDNIVWLKKFY